MCYCRGFNVSASGLCDPVQLDNICCFKLKGVKQRAHTHTHTHTHALSLTLLTHSVGI